MTRALGFLVGVGLSMAAVMLLLDSLNSRKPEAAAQQKIITDPGTEQAPAASAVQLARTDAEPLPQEADSTLPQPEAVVARPAIETLTLDASPGAAQDAALAPEPAATTLAAAVPEDSAETAPDAHEHAAPQADAYSEAQPQPETDAAGSYLFWSPFRSEWAAQGFAGRLTRSTQIPVEVVMSESGHYRVAFSYRDESERLARIERIETITGLQLE